MVILINTNMIKLILTMLRFFLFFFAPDNYIQQYLAKTGRDSLASDQSHSTLRGDIMSTANLN